MLSHKADSAGLAPRAASKPARDPYPEAGPANTVRAWG